MNENYKSPYQTRTKPNYVKLRASVRGKDLLCLSCNKQARLCVHHIDHNPHNDAEDNLQLMCKPCHSRHHALGNKHTKGLKPSDETRQLMRDNHANCSGSNNGMYGKKHSAPARKKMSDACKARKVPNRSTPLEVKQRALTLYLEFGFTKTVAMIDQSSSTLKNWIKEYKSGRLSLL